MLHLFCCSVLFWFFFPVESIGISDELKTKLKDVLIQEQQFTLGRMLGKGKNQNWTRLYIENPTVLSLLLSREKQLQAACFLSSL